MSPGRSSFGQSREERLQSDCNAAVELLLPVVRAEGQCSSLHVDRSADPAETQRRRERRPQFRPLPVARERFEVSIGEGTDIGAVLNVVESPGELSLQRHGHREERMRDAGIAPVGKDVVAVPDKDLPVMKVVVLDRVRDLERSELVTHLLHLGLEPTEARELLGAEAADLVEQRCVLTGEVVQPAVGYSSGDESVNLAYRLDLKPCVERQQIQPATKA